MVVSVTNRGHCVVTRLMTSTVSVVTVAISTPAPQASPSPWRAWPSPRASSAPCTFTPRYRVVPACSSGVSRLPPWVSGTIVARASNPAGATPIVPIIGANGRSTW